MEEERLELFQLPLQEIQSYDPSFKIDTRLHEPIWKNSFTYEEVALEILSLCAVLEPMCKIEYSNRTGGIESEYKMEYLNKFEPQAEVIIGKMKEHLQMLPRLRMTLKQYFKQSGLAVMFPRTASYLHTFRKPTFRNHKSPIDGYFHLFSTYNQLMRLSHQLNSDVNNMQNHKYIAHQTALLYQSVNQLGQPMAHHKKDIEVHFKEIKDALGRCGKEEIPRLPRRLKEWLNNITAELLDCMRVLLGNFGQPIRPVVQFLSHDISSA